MATLCRRDKKERIDETFPDESSRAGIGGSIPKCFLVRNRASSTGSEGVGGVSNSSVAGVALSVCLTSSSEVASAGSSTESFSMMVRKACPSFMLTNIRTLRKSSNRIPLERWDFTPVNTPSPLE